MREYEDKWWQAARKVGAGGSQRNAEGMSGTDSALQLLTCSGLHVAEHVLVCDLRTLVQADLEVMAKMLGGAREVLPIVVDENGRR